jgi:hypothetical protein
MFRTELRYSRTTHALCWHFIHLTPNQLIGIARQLKLVLPGSTPAQVTQLLLGLCLGRYESLLLLYVQFLGYRILRSPHSRVSSRVVVYVKTLNPPDKNLAEVIGIKQFSIKEDLTKLWRELES